MSLTGSIATWLAKKSLMLAGNKGSDFVERKLLSKRVREQHYESVKRQVANLSIYRPSHQHIDTAYVLPRLIEGNLANTFLEPGDFEAVHTALLSQRQRPDAKAVLEPSKQLEQITHSSGKSDWLKRILSKTIRFVEVRSLILEPRNTLILGEAGSGKSALIAYLCWVRMTAQKQRIPIFLTSREISETNAIELLTQTCIAQNVDLSKADSQSKLSLYIDGLDEVPKTRFKELCSEIKDIAQRYPGIPIVAACRSAFYHHELTSFFEITVAPFAPYQVEEFARKWFSGSTTGPNADEFLTAVSNADRMEELASQPLLLSLMCRAFHKHLYLPRRQSTLYDECVTALLIEWDSDRLIARGARSDEFDLQKFKWIHAYLAYEIHARGKRFIVRKEIAEILGPVLPKFGMHEEEVERFLEDICGNHGLVVRWTLETFGFGHMALQEYLAGLWIAEDRRWEALIDDERVCDPWWTNVIALSIASMSEGSRALGKLFDGTNETKLQRLEVVAQCLRSDPAVDPELREFAVQSIAKLLHNGNKRERLAAQDMLLGIEDAWTRPIVRDAMHGKHPKLGTVRN